MFSEEMVWAAKSIKGTNYAEYYVNGKPTTRCFKGWLKRLELTTGVLRPLEQARREYFTPENLATSFELARDVLLDAGVVARNLDYNAEIPYA